MIIIILYVDTISSIILSNSSVDLKLKQRITPITFTSINNSSRINEIR